MIIMEIPLPGKMVFVLKHGIGPHLDKHFDPCLINSLASDDMLWHHGNYSGLVEAIACSSPAPSHYLNQQ